MCLTSQEQALHAPRAGMSAIATQKRCLGTFELVRVKVNDVSPST